MTSVSHQLCLKKGRASSGGDRPFGIRSDSFVPNRAQGVDVDGDREVETSLIRADLPNCSKLLRFYLRNAPKMRHASCAD